jgi:hypothetical protein
MPSEAIMTSRLPIKMRVQMLQELGESKVTSVRGGRAPLQEKVPAPFKEQCEPGACTDNIPCDKSAPGGGAGMLIPQPPVVDDSYDEPAKPKSSASAPSGPPSPPPEVRRIPAKQPSKMGFTSFFLPRT